MAKKKDEVIQETDPLDGKVHAAPEIVTVVTDATDDSSVVTPFTPDNPPRDILNEIANIRYELQWWVNDRANNYPSVGEQLAALYEARQGNDKPLKEIDAKIKEVKETFAKPDFAKLEAKLAELEAELAESNPLPAETGSEEKPEEE